MVGFAGQLAALQERQRRQLIYEQLPEHEESPPAPTHRPFWLKPAEPQPRPLPHLPPPPSGVPCAAQRRAKALLQRTFPSLGCVVNEGHSNGALRQADGSWAVPSTHRPAPTGQQGRLNGAMAPATAVSSPACATSATCANDTIKTAGLELVGGAASPGDEGVGGPGSGSGCCAATAVGGAAAARGAPRRRRSRLPWSHLAEREAEEAAQTADGDFPELLRFRHLQPDWLPDNLKYPPALVGVVHQQLSDSSSTGSQAVGDVTGGAQAAVGAGGDGSSPGGGAGAAGPLAARPPAAQQPNNGSGSDSGHPPAEVGQELPRPVKEEEEQALQQEQARERLWAALQRMTAAQERDLALAARAMRAVEGALSGRVELPTEQPQHHSAPRDSRGFAVGLRGLGRDSAGGGGAEGAGAQPEPQPSPPVLRPWWMLQPEREPWPQRRAFAEYESRVLKLARTAEATIEAVHDWMAPYGVVAAALRVLPAGYEHEQLFPDADEIYETLEAAAKVAGPLWCSLCAAMYNGVRAEFAAREGWVLAAGEGGGAGQAEGAPADAATEVAQTDARPSSGDGAAAGAGVDAMGGAAAAGMRGSVRPGTQLGDSASSPKESSGAPVPGDRSTQTLSAPASAAQSAPARAPALGPGSGPGQDLQARPVNARQLETAPEGLRQKRRKPRKQPAAGAADPGASRAARERRRAQQEVEEQLATEVAEQFYQCYDQACERVLAAALTPAICSTRTRQLLLRLLLSEPGEGASLLPSPQEVGQEAGPLLRRGAEEAMAARFAKTMAPAVRSRWLWVLRAAARGHKDAVQVAGRALAGMLLLRETAKQISSEWDPVLCAATTVVLSIMLQQAPEPHFYHTITPDLVYQALLAGPLPRPPGALWAELRSHELLDTVPRSTLVSPLSNTHLADTVTRLLCAPTTVVAWCDALTALRRPACPGIEVAGRRHARTLAASELNSWREWANAYVGEEAWHTFRNPLVLRHTCVGTLCILLHAAHLPTAAAASASAATAATAGGSAAEQLPLDARSHQAEVLRVALADRLHERLWPENMSGITLLPGGAALVLLSATQERELAHAAGNGAGGSAQDNSSSRGASGQGGASGIFASVLDMDRVMAAAPEAGQSTAFRHNTCLVMYPIGPGMQGALPQAVEAATATADAATGSAAEDGAGAETADGACAGGCCSQAEGADGAGGCGNSDCSRCCQMKPSICFKRMALPAGAAERLQLLTSRLPVVARVSPDSRAEDDVAAILQALLALQGGGDGGGHPPPPPPAAGLGGLPDAASGTGGVTARLHGVGVTGCQRLLLEVMPQVRAALLAQGRDVGVIPVAVLDYGAAAAVEGADAGAAATAAPAAAAAGAAAEAAAEAASLEELAAGYRRTMQTLLPLVPTRPYAPAVLRVAEAVAYEVTLWQEQQKRATAGSVTDDDGPVPEVTPETMEAAHHLLRLLTISQGSGPACRQAFAKAVDAMGALQVRLTDEWDDEVQAAATAAAAAAAAAAATAAAAPQAPGAASLAEATAGEGVSEAATRAADAAAGAGGAGGVAAAAEAVTRDVWGSVWRGRRRLTLELLLVESDVGPLPQPPPEGNEAAHQQALMAQAEAQGEQARERTPEPVAGRDGEPVMVAQGWRHAQEAAEQQGTVTSGGCSGLLSVGAWAYLAADVI